MYFIFGCAGTSLLSGLYVSRGEQGLLSRCGAGMSHGDGSLSQSTGFLGAPQHLCHTGSVVAAHGLYSAGSAHGLYSAGSVAVAQGLSYSAARGVFPDGVRVSSTSKQILCHWAPREALCTGWYMLHDHSCSAALNSAQSVVPKLSFPASNWKVAGCLTLSENYRSPGVWILAYWLGKDVTIRYCQTSIKAENQNFIQFKDRVHKYLGTAC